MTKTGDFDLGQTIIRELLFERRLNPMSHLLPEIHTSMPQDIRSEMDERIPINLDLQLHRLIPALLQRRAGFDNASFKQKGLCILHDSSHLETTIRQP